MNRDAVRCQLARCLAPCFRLERDDYAIGLDADFVDRWYVPTLRVEDHYVRAIQVFDRDHGKNPLSLWYDDCHTQRNLARADDPRQAKRRIPRFFSAVICQ